MTAFARRSPRLSSHPSSPARPAERGVRLALALGLLLVSAACGQSLNAPFVELSLANLPATAVEADVDVKLDAVMKSPTPKFTGTASTLDKVTISFPPDSRGSLILTVRVLDAASCVVATGSAGFDLTANQVYTQTISLTAMAPTANCQNLMVPLTVAKAGDGKGTVTSMDGVISCGATCTQQLGPGAAVTLTAQPAAAPTGSTYQFVGWNVPGCTTAPVCSFQLTQATTATATFRCSGFCPEAPAGQTSDLYGIWGFNTTKIVAVGASGTILQSNGTTWTKVTSPVTTALRAIHGAQASLVGIAVGDGGAIVNTMDGGGSWATMSSNSVVNLRAAYVAAATPLVAYAAGDNQGPNASYLKYSTGAWAKFLQGGYDLKWNAMFGLDPTFYVLVGAAGANCRVASDIFTIMASGSGTADLLGVWGTAANNLFAVGASGTTIKYNGTTWNSVTNPGTGVTLRAIYGFGGNSIYAVGDSGTIWKYDGTSWTVVPSPPTAMAYNAIWGNNATDFYVVGQGGQILHNRP